MSLLTQNQLENALQNLSGWNPTGKDIRKEFQFAHFMGAIDFVNRVAALAEEANHHPDIEIRYDKVVLTLVTHREKGITEKDIRLAHEIENLGN